MTNTTTIPQSLRDALPTGVTLDDCAVTTIADLDVVWQGETVSDDAVAIVLPGYCADDGNAEIEIPDAESAEDAAQEYVDGGDWGDRSETSWIRVYVWQTALALDDDGEPIDLTIDRDSHTVTLEAEEPDCTEDDHDWQSPIEVVGGIEENPGVWGHGGGVIITEVCAHCGVYRVTDTWAQDPSTGEQGLESVEYREADEDSLAWVAQDNT